MQNNSKIKTLTYDVSFLGGEIQPKDNRERKMRLILIYNKTLLNEYFINYVGMTDK